MVEQGLSIKLRFPCPGDICSKSKLITWGHENCGGDIYID